MDDGEDFRQMGRKLRDKSAAILRLVRQKGAVICDTLLYALLLMSV